MSNRLAASSRRPLPPAQLTETDDRLDGLRGALRKLFGRAHQLRLGFGPFATRCEHGRVEGATDREQVPKAEAAAELLHPLAPLGRAPEAAYPLAAVDHEAAGLSDQLEIVHLAPGGGGGRLVEAPHALRDPAIRHERSAFDREREHLQVEEPKAPRKPDRSPGTVACGRDVAGEKKCEERLAHREERVLGAQLEVVEEAARALHPAVEDRLLGAKYQRILGQMECQASRASMVALAVELVCAFPRFSESLRVVEPPQGPAQTLERLRRLPLLERLHEQTLGSTICSEIALRTIRPFGSARLPVREAGAVQA